VSTIFGITESKGKHIDAYCKIIATLFVVVGGGITMLAYLNGRADSIKNAAIEARKPIFEKQLESCLAGVSLAYSVAYTEPDAEEGKRARVEFESLFRTTIEIVADNDIYIPASNLIDCIAAGPSCRGTLALRAYNLGEGCRKSLNDK
jgi:hypothetical protein